MSKLNGHTPKDGAEVTSLEDARRAAQKKAREAQRANNPDGPRTSRDWLLGGLFIAMAIGMVVFWILGLGNSVNVVQK